jgi:hypothetical protein
MATTKKASQKGNTEGKKPKNVPKPAEILNNLGIDAICDMMCQDMSYRQIGEKIGVDIHALHNWCNADEQRSARVKACLKFAARYNDEEGLRAIQELPAAATSAQIAQMRELCQYRKWRASKRSPKEYGENLKISGDEDNPLRHIVTVLSKEDAKL